MPHDPPPDLETSEVVYVDDTNHQRLPNHVTATTTDFDWDHEARRLVSDGKLGEAIEVVDRHAGKWLMQVINLFGNGAELESPYTNVLKRLIRRLADPAFDTTRPIKPYLFTVAKFAGKDQWREGSRRGGREIFDSTLLEACPAPPDPEANGRRLESQEFLAFLAALVAKLPPKQKLVASTYVDNFELFEHKKDFRELARLVALKTGEPESPDAVRKNLEEAFAKLQRALSRKEDVYEKPTGGNST